MPFGLHLVWHESASEIFESVLSKISINYAKQKASSGWKMPFCIAWRNATLTERMYTL